MPTRLLALIGERDPSKTAHRGIEASIERHRAVAKCPLELRWISTDTLTPATVETVLREATGVWCVPGSPYASTEGALLAIRHARVAGIPFLGTCGGFQHALLEFSQNVLGEPAQHAETAPGAEAPLIAKLSCSLVGAQGRVVATDPDFAALLGGPSSVEEYHCNYGLNERLAGRFRGTPLRFVARDQADQVRAFRLEGHRFFVGTLFQPERRALHGDLHPLVAAFLDTV